ncbi:MAG TPA: DUF1573 domain-containing protein [Flavobacteriales bacterium]|nr:DUF1573 domain-containing protein [Flavobacteriales bacterium]HIN40520.1 DUF1573 domain-containing protein [Flavobacteriales bacterium]
MNDIKEQIKIVLLVIIAGTLIIEMVMSPAINDDNNESPEIVSAQTQPVNAAQSLNNTPNPLVQEAVKIEKPKGPLSVISFDEETFDFGNIKQNSTDNKHVFKFTNKGSNPLIISNAKGSCGCTVPQFPKEPIPPGETGEIVVEYKPGKQKGNQRKTITVTANTDPPDTRIAISAIVEEAPE